jgi:hypothetical protein
MKSIKLLLFILISLFIGLGEGAVNIAGSIYDSARNGEIIDDTLKIGSIMIDSTIDTAKGTYNYFSPMFSPSDVNTITSLYGYDTSAVTLYQTSNLPDALIASTVAIPVGMAVKTAGKLEDVVDVGKTLSKSGADDVGRKSNGNAGSVGVGDTKTILEKNAYHQSKVDNLKTDYINQGYKVSESDISFGSACSTGRCKPDIVVASSSDGKIQSIIEVKTGNAQLSIRQTEIYPQIRDGSAIPKGYVAEKFGLMPNIPLKDQGYPNGIPVIEKRFNGLQ